VLVSRRSEDPRSEGGLRAGLGPRAVSKLAHFVPVQRCWKALLLGAREPELDVGRVHDMHCADCWPAEADRQMSLLLEELYGNKVSQMHLDLMFQ
jgi:hypothetical protein